MVMLKCNKVVVAKVSKLWKSQLPGLPSSAWELKQKQILSTWLYGTSPIAVELGKKFLRCGRSTERNVRV